MNFICYRVIEIAKTGDGSLSFIDISGQDREPSPVFIPVRHKRRSKDADPCPDLLAKRAGYHFPVPRRLLLSVTYRISRSPYNNSIGSIEICRKFCFFDNIYTMQICQPKISKHKISEPESSPLDGDMVSRFTAD